MRPSPKVKPVAKRTPANGVTERVAAEHKRAEMQESVAKRLMFPLVPTGQRLTQTGAWRVRKLPPAAAVLQQWQTVRVGVQKKIPIVNHVL